MTHSYDIEVSYTDVDGKLIIEYIYVSARNRTQAAKIMRDRGYEVRSVNMCG